MDEERESRWWPSERGGGERSGEVREVDFFTENWFFILILLLCIGMHFFHGHGGHGAHGEGGEHAGHGGHGARESDHSRHGGSGGGGSSHRDHSGHGCC